MDIELIIPFLIASTLILIMPGPTIILVITQAATYGKRSAIPLVLGVFLGDFTAMTLSLLGLGTLMTASAYLFTVFKWIGAIYLIYLGINLFKSDKEDVSQEDDRIKSSSSLFKSSFIVTVLNPKSIAFFVAFFPQFINPFNPLFKQFFCLGSIFLVLAVLNAGFYAFFAGKISEHIKKDKIQNYFKRLGGTSLVAAGILTASMKRS